MPKPQILAILAIQITLLPTYSFTQFSPNPTYSISSNPTKPPAEAKQPVIKESSVAQPSVAQPSPAVLKEPKQKPIEENQAKDAKEPAGSSNYKLEIENH